MGLYCIFLTCDHMKTSSRREEIIAAAASLFKEKGYVGVSVRDIAQIMDMKAASLYNHIENKQEILSVLVLGLARDFTSGMAAIQEMSISPLQQIEKVIELHIDITVTQSEALAALNNDWMHLEGDDLEEFLALREGYEDEVRGIIKEGIRIGQIQPRHPEVILFSILSTLRTLYLWYQKRGKLDVNILKKDMVAVLLRGIV